MTNFEENKPPARISRCPCCHWVGLQTQLTAVYILKGDMGSGYGVAGEQCGVCGFYDKNGKQFPYTDLFEKDGYSPDAAAKMARKKAPLWEIIENNIPVEKTVISSGPLKKDELKWCDEDSSGFGPESFRTNNETWLIYSRKKNAFWRDDGAGYTDNIDHAGRYAHSEAVLCSSNRDLLPDGLPAEIIMLAPECFKQRGDQDDD